MIGPDFLALQLAGPNGKGRGRPMLRVAIRASGQSNAENHFSQNSGDTSVTCWKALRPGALLYSVWCVAHFGCCFVYRPVWLACIYICVYMYYPSLVGTLGICSVLLGMFGMYSQLG